jgi:hypothetical protein
MNKATIRIKGIWGGFVMVLGGCGEIGFFCRRLHYQFLGVL